MICRGLRLGMTAGLGVALAMPALATEVSRGLATQTTLSVETRDQAGRTKAVLSIAVAGEDGRAAAGAVAVEDHGKELAGAALDADGQTRLVLDLTAGDHSLRAVYLGDATHAGSVSETTGVHGQSSSTPDFEVSVSPAALSLPVGESGKVTVSVTPENNAALTAPMFVTLSCSGLPDESSCTFTPENLEILASSCPNPKLPSCPITSTMVVETQLATHALATPANRQPGRPIAWALLPGAFALLGLAWGGRRRAWLSRLSLLLLVGLVSMLGATACAARYNYFNHGPPANPATPAGTYTINVTAQSSNGITALTHSKTMVLTVQ